MPGLFKAAALAVALLTAVPATANAVAFITLDPAAPNGSISGVFGDTGIAAGVFSHVIPFALPDAGISAATITSILTDGTNDLTLTSVLLNGTPFLLGTTGDVEFRYLSNLGTLAGPQTLTINGFSGGEGSYGGTIAFTPGAIPEPAAWAMLIVGFGMVGAGMRLRHRSGALTVHA